MEGARHLARRSASLALAWAYAAWIAGCGMTLVATEIPTSEEPLAQLRRGGEAWGCHERTSDVFRLYLVCPAQDTVFGVKDWHGRLSFACPDLDKRECRRFARELRVTGGWRPPAESP